MAIDRHCGSIWPLMSTEGGGGRILKSRIKYVIPKLKILEEQIVLKSLLGVKDMAKIYV